jgi:hypothetical protein
LQRTGNPGKNRGVTSQPSTQGPGTAFLAGSLVGILNGLVYFLAGAGILAVYVYRASKSSVSDNVGVLLALPILVFVVFPLLVVPLSIIEILLARKRRPGTSMLFLIPPLALLPLVGLGAMVLAYFPLLAWFSQLFNP